MPAHQTEAAPQLEMAKKSSPTYFKSPKIGPTSGWICWSKHRGHQTLDVALADGREDGLGAEIVSAKGQEGGQRAADDAIFNRKRGLAAQRNADDVLVFQLLQAVTRGQIVGDLHLEIASAWRCRSS